MTHTPGPWTFDQEDDNSTDFWVFQANGPARIAVEVSERDAALIAAAPELLAALQALVAEYEPNIKTFALNAPRKARWQDAIAAIAKATTGA